MNNTCFGRLVLLVLLLSSIKGNSFDRYIPVAEGKMILITDRWCRLACVRCGVVAINDKTVNATGIWPLLEISRRTVYGIPNDVHTDKVPFCSVGTPRHTVTIGVMYI